MDATACIFEDCDQDALYCAGHALEFANVRDQNEAIDLRHRLDTAARDIADITGQRDLAEERRNLYRTLLAELLVATQDYLFAGSPTPVQRERLIDALARARVFAGQPREAA